MKKNRFKEWRKINGYKQQEVADMLRLSVSMVCLLEKGIKRPSLDTAIKIETLTNGYASPRDW